MEEVSISFTKTLCVLSRISKSGMKEQNELFTFTQLPHLITIFSILNYILENNIVLSLNKHYYN